METLTSDNGRAFASVTLPRMEPVPCAIACEASVRRPIAHSMRRTSGEDCNDIADSSGRDRTEATRQPPDGFADEYRTVRGYPRKVISPDILSEGSESRSRTAV